jgi:hypothetical protein
LLFALRLRYKIQRPAEVFFLRANARCKMEPTAGKIAPVRAICLQSGDNVV